MKNSYLAIDLGAESGRVMLGALEDGQICLLELHRFPNPVQNVEGSLQWNIPALFEAAKEGLRKAAALNPGPASVSTDSWGLDYVLLDPNGSLLPPAHHYRDPRTSRGVARVQSLVPWPEVFAETGIQFMPLNTIYQLAAESPERLAQAQQLLPIADAFNYFLSGVTRAEASLASTTQLVNPRTQSWSDNLIQTLGLPRSLFPPLVPSGTRLGPLKPELSQEIGLPALQVIASCSHDTGAAVAAVPGIGDDWAYLSSGTWSLLGVELDAPLLTDQCREFNLTNEIGFGGSVRLLKNIIGLWIVQECRREWGRAGQEMDYAALMKLAADAPPFVSLINPDDARFIAPGDMPARIAAYCRETGQPAPSSPGATVRCVLESLALLYARVFAELQQVTGKKLERLHVVGGGSQNTLLNQFTASALGVPVLAGPVEATALGNILVQALTLGDIPSLPAARALVAQSFPLTRYEPADAGRWSQVANSFAHLQQISTTVKKSPSL